MSMAHWSSTLPKTICWVTRVFSTQDKDEYLNAVVHDFCVYFPMRIDVGPCSYPHSKDEGFNN